jgi:hypothetical protein
MVYVENGKLSAIFDTSRTRFDTSYYDLGYAAGGYTVVAYDREGNTDEATVSICPCPALPTPSPRGTITPTETPITPESTEPTETPVTTPTESSPTPATPSFETIFAIAGLLAVAYILRRRK